MQARRTDAATFRAAPSGKTDSGGGWLRVHSSDPACCFCAVWAPAGPRGVAVAMFGHTGFGHSHLPKGVHYIREYLCTERHSHS